MVLALVTPPTPSGRRSEQLKPSGDMSVHDQSKPHETPSNALDALRACLRRTMTAARAAEVTIVAGLDIVGLAVTLPTDAIVPLAERVPVDLGQVVRDSPWPNEDKLTAALMYRELGRLCAQVIEIIAKLTPALVNEISSRSYGIDDYIWKTEVLERARVNGAMDRVVLLYFSGRMAQIASLLEYLAVAPENTRLTISNGSGGNGNVQVVTPDVAA